MFFLIKHIEKEFKCFIVLWGEILCRKTGLMLPNVDACQVLSGNCMSKKGNLKATMAKK